MRSHPFQWHKGNTLVRLTLIWCCC